MPHDLFVEIPSTIRHTGEVTLVDHGHQNLRWSTVMAAELTTIKLNADSHLLLVGSHACGACLAPAMIDL